MFYKGINKHIFFVFLKNLDCNPHTFPLTVLSGPLLFTTTTEAHRQNTFLHLRYSSILHTGLCCTTAGIIMNSATLFFHSDFKPLTTIYNTASLCTVGKRGRGGAKDPGCHHYLHIRQSVCCF